jgi:hypothetical protein
LNTKIVASGDLKKRLPNERRLPLKAGGEFLKISSACADEICPDNVYVQSPKTTYVIKEYPNETKLDEHNNFPKTTYVIRSIPTPFPPILP